MRRNIVITIILAAIFGFVAYQYLTTQRGGTYISCGLSVPTEYEPYCETARAELRTWLAQHGFSPEPSRRPHSNGEAGSGERVEWFVGRHAHSSPFHVVLIIPERGRAGVQAHVEWSFHGFRPSVAASDREAQVFAELLRDWFQEYERQHPLQKNAV